MILWSQKDIQDYYGVSRSTVHIWARARTFPRPLGEPACGKVWEAWRIEEWVENFRPSIGRPKGS